ncbi:MAG TPA: SDR family oxidoreductase [Gemmatimonadales bacterium]
MTGGGGGRTFLITGATGFLGKIVLEELVRRRDELEVDRVYVLIRARGVLRAEERFRREIAAAACFAGLPPGWARDVFVVEGTLARSGLELSPAVRDELTGGVTHALHTAASVNFDLPLVDAARANVTTSLHLLELAQSCPRLERLVCVSTAYATPHPGEGLPVEEKLAPLPAPAEELYASILSGKVAQAELLARSGHPNTYTFTKSLTEHLLVARCNGTPLTILRPSIISASWRHPFPGWIDSAAAFGAFVILSGLGHLRAVVGDPDARVDLIPVDEVAARALEACRSNGAEGSGKGPVIRHAVAGLERSPRIRDCWDAIRDFFRTHQVARRPTLAYLGPRGLRFKLAQAIHHGLGIAMAELRSRKLRRSAIQLRARLEYVNRVFPYFTLNSFRFRSSWPLGDGFEPCTYVRTVCRGVYRHILGRDDTEWTLAGRAHPGHGGDLRWALGQPHGNGWIRFASWMVTKVLRRAVERVTVDIPSFEAARREAPDGSPLVIVPNHRSYLDFVLCSYLAFARPDLGIPIPHIAATLEFGRIPILGRILSALHAFYLRRGLGREDPTSPDGSTPSSRRGARSSSSSRASAAGPGSSCLPSVACSAVCRVPARSAPCCRSRCRMTGYRRNGSSHWS